MSRADEYYRRLWEEKPQNQETRREDRKCLYRVLLDRLTGFREGARHELVGSVLSGGSSLLDIGCWGGEATAAFGALDKFETVCGVDISAESIVAARERGIDAHLCDLNSQELPFEDGHFDCVTLVSVLEHLFDAGFVLAECFRVLRPGGTLVVQVPNIASLSNRLRVMMGRLPVTSYDPGYEGGHIHNFTPRSLRDLVRGRGFAVVAERATGDDRMIVRGLKGLAGDILFVCKRPAAAQLPERDSSSELSGAG